MNVLEGMFMVQDADFMVLKLQTVLVFGLLFDW
jgi:hypothetical protein